MYAVWQLAQKAVKREMDASIFTLMYVFLLLTYLLRILELAIDPENYMNIISPSARASLLWLVILVDSIERRRGIKIADSFVFGTGLFLWICGLRADLYFLVSVMSPAVYFLFWL